MGFSKCMEDNEELWTENNRYTENMSLYGSRIIASHQQINVKDCSSFRGTNCTTSNIGKSDSYTPWWKNWDYEPIPGV